jgi:hypothetical protein
VTAGTGSAGTTGGSYPIQAIATIDDNGDLTEINGVSCSDCDLNVDFGFVLAGDHTIAGHIFFDANGDGGLYSSGTDTGYSDVPVYLWDSSNTLVAVTTTGDVNGSFTFANVPDGTYTISFDPTIPRFKGMEVTASPNAGCTSSTTCNHNEIVVTGNIADQDFGLYAAVDYGDLPGTYALTLSADEGAGHITGTLRLGSYVDADADGTASSDAQGDDTSGVDDEDGITLIPLNWKPGGTAAISATVSGSNGFLVGYVDWSGDGDFGDTGERVIAGNTTDGINSFTIKIPENTITSGTINARFRLYDTDLMVYYGPGGLAENGEVEDYQWDAPNPTAVQLLGIGNLRALAAISLLALSLVLLSSVHVYRNK